MSEKEKIEEISTYIYNVKTVEDCRLASKKLKESTISGNTYSCLSDYLTFRSVEIKKIKHKIKEFKK